MSSQNQFQVLPDEMVSVIGLWLVDQIKYLVSFHATCQRMRVILLKPSFRREIVHQLGIPLGGETSALTLEQVGFFEAIQRAGLMQENRIGFSYASTEIEDPTPEEEGCIMHNMQRIESVRKVWKQFGSSALIIDAHVGTLAPRGVASRFSRVRGAAVLQAILQDDQEEHDNDDRIITQAWGKRVAHAASMSSHRYAQIAREGKGWAEIYFTLHELELPPRPDYYHGINVFSFVPIPSARRIRDELI